MKDDYITDSSVLEEKLDLLIKRFKEQQGIIDSYVQREREWKKDKVIHKQEISKLEKTIIRLEANE
ncbi:MAG: hypothetical protein VW894_02215 [Gammaproteobacteria bacterium]|jgi:hypothetical protein|uniref:Uncharacterized protein n=1 Tax=SAR86 cluster bacterium SAR86B TaxID=1123867 RepID=J5KFG6_9GAMM|nr:MAG: hypothetical protein NT02SARS_0047 [SAR86 cluster bacterium SAR86B]|tara:strand:+ start:2022 stop:2219 length:198 start_codon:yes stop_codon:yes gene_type:complete